MRDPDCAERLAALAEAALRDASLDVDSHASARLTLADVEDRGARWGADEGKPSMIEVRSQDRAEALRRAVFDDPLCSVPLRLRAADALMSSTGPDALTLEAFEDF